MKDKLDNIEPNQKKAQEYGDPKTLLQVVMILLIFKVIKLLLFAYINPIFVQEFISAGGSNEREILLKNLCTNLKKTRY